MATTPVMSSAEIVTDQYTRSRSYADALEAKVTDFISDMGAAVVQTPVVDVRFDTTTIAPPTMEELPDLPSITPYAPQVVATPSEDVPELGGQEVQIPAFTVAAPTVTFPAAPSVSIGQVPSIPELGQVALPTAPEITIPQLPQMLSLNTPTFTGTDQHADWLQKLKDAPTLSLVRPQPLNYRKGRAYESELLEAVKARLLERIQGGTGLSPEVERLIFGRAHDREAQVMLDAEADMLRANEALGFSLPQGVTVAQLERLRREFRDKMAGHARDMAIEQAKLEQSNLQQVVAEGVQLESKLMDNALQLEQQSFEIARATADSMLQVYNAAVREFEVLLQQYNAFATTYRTLIEAESMKLEQYKAELQAEQTKASINQSLVEQYKAQISAQQSRVEIYKTQLDGARAQISMEEAKIQAAAERVRGFVATVNAETAKLDLHKTLVGAEQTKVDIYKAQVDAFTAQANIHAERARIQIAAVEAKSRVIASRYDGFRARVQAEASRAEAQSSAARTGLDAYRAAAAAVESKANMTTRIWQAKLEQYRASVEVSANAQRSNAAFALQAAGMNQEVAKVGAQTLSQLLASAWNVVSTGASTSGSVSESHSYSHQVSS